MLPHHPALAAKLNRQSALGLTALTASWLLGTASIDRGLVQDGSDIFAILGFLTACALWLSTRHTLTCLPRVQIVEAVLLGWWTLNLALCAATGGEVVYDTIFFIACVVATLGLIAIATLSPLPRSGSALVSTARR
jgi:hypothetical protein